MSSSRTVIAIAVRGSAASQSTATGNTGRIGSRRAIRITKPISPFARQRPVHGAVPAKAASMTSLAGVQPPGARTCNSSVARPVAVSRTISTTRARRAAMRVRSMQFGTRCRQSCSRICHHDGGTSSGLRRIRRQPPARATAGPPAAIVFRRPAKPRKRVRAAVEPDVRRPVNPFPVCLRAHRQDDCTEPGPLRPPHAPIAQHENTDHHGQTHVTAPSSVRGLSVSVVAGRRIAGPAPITRRNAGA